MRLTVVVPTYNEAENLPALASAFFALPLPDTTLLIVDDNSPDGTGDLAEQLLPQYPGRMQVLHRPGKMGLGPAYLAGFKHAFSQGAEAVAQMDADFSHPLEKLVEMRAAVDSGFDFAIGSRYAPGGSLDPKWPLWRKGLSAWGNFYARTILGMKVRDCTAGFRVWRKEALLKMPLDRVRSSGYAFQVELTYLSHLLGLRPVEIPIHFIDRRWGQSKMSFRIQREAAVRVWMMLFEYRDLKRRAG